MLWTAVRMLADHVQPSYILAEQDLVFEAFRTHAASPPHGGLRHGAVPDTISVTPPLCREVHACMTGSVACTPSDTAHRVTPLPQWALRGGCPHAVLRASARPPTRRSRTTLHCTGTPHGG